MRIGMFTNTYLPQVNGVSRSVSTFRQALSDLGHEVHVFCQASPGYHDEAPHIHRYPALPLERLNYSLSFPYSPAIQTLLSELDLQVVHSHHPGLLGDVAADVARRQDLPLVFTYHTRYQDYSHYVPLLPRPLAEGLVSALVERYLAKCAHIITPSRSVRDLLLRDGLSVPISVIPTPVKLQAYTAADGSALRQRFGIVNQFTLVSMARLAPEKNWKTLLIAVAQVIQQRPGVRLLTIGDGPSRQELIDEVQHLGIASQVIFAGRVPFEDVPTHLKVGDLFVFASLTETQGLATLEAMAAGLPVVAVDASGTHDVLQDGVQGLLVADDSQALADGILRLIDDAQLRGKMAAAAQQRAAQFGMQALAQQLLEVYQQVCEKQY